MNLTHLLNDALGTEWMMTPEACAALKHIYLGALSVKRDVGHLTASDIARMFERNTSEGFGESLHMLRDESSEMAAQTEPMKGTSYTSLYKGVAIIDVIGPIVPRVRGASSGSIGAQQIRNDFITAFESENVKAIMLNVDSPGGDARGISELAQTIARARAKNTKPIYAYAAGWMASAAYFISAASHRIVANDWASLGSIGVVIGVPPKTAEDDIEFVNTESPYKRPDPATDAGKGVYQEKADYLGGLFIDAVAELRGVPREKVVSDFGRGGTLVGKRAVKAGLADALGTFDSTLHSLVTAKPLPGAGAALSTDGEETMSDKKTLWQRLFGTMSAEEREEARAALAADSGGATPPAGRATGAQAESDEVKTLRQKAEAYDRERAESRTRAAEAFARDLVVTQKKLLPAGFEAGQKLYAICAEAGEKGTAALAEFVKAMPAHSLTTEQAAAKLPAGATVLENDSDPQQKMLADAETSIRAYGERANNGGRPKPATA